MYTGPYMNTNDVEDAYVKVKGSHDGWNAFKKAAQAVASRTKNGAFIYDDEPALYMVFERHLGLELKSQGIDCFGRLMQYIS